MATRRGQLRLRYEMIDNVYLRWFLPTVLFFFFGKFGFFGKLLLRIIIPNFVISYSGDHFFLFIFMETGLCNSKGHKKIATYIRDYS